jgi:hypothetical protein
MKEAVVKLDEIRKRSKTVSDAEVLTWISEGRER